MVNYMAKKINLIALLIIVFFVAIAVWYSPILFKGYSVVNIWEDALVARNLAKFNVFGAENSQNVILASSLVKEQAQSYSLGNKLTPLIIAQIFKVTGIPNYDNLIFRLGAACQQG